MRKALALLAVVALVAVGATSAAAKNAPDGGYTDRTVTFENEGCTIVGTLSTPTGVRGAAPAILMLHGFTGSRWELPVTGTDETMFSRTARVLAQHGFIVLRIDFCGSGDSDGTFDQTTFSGQISDALAAVDWLDHQRHTGHIGILGLSQGGLVGSVTASRDKRVEALVLWSPVANPPDTYKTVLGEENVLAGLVNDSTHITLPWGAEIDLQRAFFEDLYNVDPIAAIAQYRGPMQVVVGVNDTIVTPQPYYGQLYLNYHPGMEELVVLDAEHIFDILTPDAPTDLDLAIGKAQAWFMAALRP